MKRSFPIHSAEPLSDDFMETLHAVIKDLKLPLAPVTSEGGNDLTLVLGKPSDDFSEAGTPVISGPSEGYVMGRPAGLEMLRRSIQLWNLTVTGKLESPRYKYMLVVPDGGEPEEGCIPVSSMGNEIQCTLGHGALIVDIETSGDVSEDEPEDTELLSVAVLWMDKDGYQTANRVWTRVALEDPDCRLALAAILCCGVPLIAHNAQFDFKWLNNHLAREFANRKGRAKYGDAFGKVVPKLRIYPTHDTLLMHFVMFPGASGEHGLKDLGQKILGAPEWEDGIKPFLKGGKGHYERIPQSMLCAYNAADVYWTWLLYLKLKQWMDESTPAFRKVYDEVVMPATRMFIDVESTEAGWPLNVELAKKTEQKLLAQAAAQLKKFRKMVGDPTEYLSVTNAEQRARRIKNKELWDANDASEDAAGARWMIHEDGRKLKLRKPLPLNDDHEFNPGSWKQVLTWLNDHGCNADSTDAEAQAELLADESLPKKVRKFLVMLEDYRHTTKMCSTYITAALKRCRQGRVRPRHKVFGTVTGRLSGAMTHTTPRIGRDGLKDREYREIYTTEPGQVIIGCDYGQIETRIVAELTNDEQMIDDLQLGRADFFDLLLPGAFPDVFKSLKAVQKMRGTDKGTHAHYRQMMKPVSHGANYLRQPAAIAEQLGIPVWQAVAMFDSYMERYPNLQRWQDEVMEFVEGKVDPIWGVPGLWTRFGRRFQAGTLTHRNRNIVQRSAVAFAPQSTGSDLTVSAAIDLHNGGKLGEMGFRLCGFIHDALYGIGPEENAEEAKTLMSERMIASAAKVFHRVPFTVDGKIGKDWADVDHPLKGKAA